MNEEENLENEESEDLVDESSSEEEHKPYQYDITSFGADYDVEGLVKRLRRGDILIPPFQRDYVWNINEASRFIESLLLGLPVPGIFLARDLESNKLVVIDGQQRLKSLLYFYDGYFNPKPDDKRRRIFRLTKVQEEFEGVTYDNLKEKDRVLLDDSIIHATILKQESPKEQSESSVYLVFERLNTGGRKLVPQEIRAAIGFGKFLEQIEKINANDAWRKIIGPPHKRLKDRELILRFLSFYYDRDNYYRPMREFLNTFLIKNRNPEPEFLEDCNELFTKTVEYVFGILGQEAFRPEGWFNAAVFDSVMVGVANRIMTSDDLSEDEFISQYNFLVKDKNFTEAVTTGTASEKSVSTRFRLAKEAFEKND